jgi:membrane associated rhomboid family serine protease
MWEDLKWRFQYGGMVSRLIMINVAVFLAVNAAAVIGFLITGDIHHIDAFVRWFQLPADLRTFGRQFWSIFTHMFLHQDIMHILFNMLWLYWFGTIFKNYLGESRVLPVYILGGLCGGILLMAAYNIFPALDPTYAYALGASAAVMAIVLAAAATVPEHSIHLIFLGPVKLKWIAAVVVVIDFISIPGGNSGGHIAHLGGALFGYLYAVQYKKGNDLSRPFYSVVDSVRNFFDFSSKSSKKSRPGRSKVRMAFSNKEKAAAVKTPSAKSPEDFNGDKQERIDEILDKISRSGYDSLSKEEKAFLFQMSKE